MGVVGEVVTIVGVDGPAAERDLMSGNKCFRREDTEERDVMRVTAGLMSRDRAEDDGSGAAWFSSSSSINDLGRTRSTARVQAGTGT
jgi:hypothetical protein